MPESRLNEKELVSNQFISNLKEQYLIVNQFISDLKKKYLKKKREESFFEFFQSEIYKIPNDPLFIVKENAKIPIGDFFAKTRDRVYPEYFIPEAHILTKNGQRVTDQNTLKDKVIRKETSIFGQSGFLFKDQNYLFNSFIANLQPSHKNNLKVRPLFYVGISSKDKTHIEDIDIKQHLIFQIIPHFEVKIEFQQRFTLDEALERAGFFKAFENLCQTNQIPPKNKVDFLLSLLGNISVGDFHSKGGSWYYDMQITPDNLSEKDDYFYVNDKENKGQVLVAKNNKYFDLSLQLCHTVEEVRDHMENVYYMSDPSNPPQNELCFVKTSLVCIGFNAQNIPKLTNK